TDGRSNPTLPLSAVLSTWQWGLLRQTPSTERIGDLLKDRRWRARLGLQPEQGGSPDRAAQIPAGLSPGLPVAKHRWFDREERSRRHGLRFP
ncbi:MAG: hypothetical protein DMF35_08650, partial [Verrucomicrobia bacterium]